MELSVATALTVTIIMILFSGIFSGSEIAFVQSSRVRMAIDDATRGGLVDRIIRIFTVHEDMFISTLLVGNNVVLVIYGITISILVNPILESWFGNNDALVLICNTLFSTSVILVTGEFFPKATFRINPNFMMRLLAFPLFCIYLLIYPVSWLVSSLSKGMMKLFGIKDADITSSALTIEQLDRYLDQSIEHAASKEVVENEVKIFHNAIDFKDTQIAECMIPRNEIVAVSLEKTTTEELRKRFIATGLSKIVVYKEDIDDIVGYIHISELFTPDVDWLERLKPVIHTPETMLANKMMRRMLSEKRSVVIVVDEFGGTAGLVTLEDLVEEIFGEIEDEHDRDRRWGHVLPDGGWEFTGRAEISAINDEYDLDIPESDKYHTIAGYLLDSLGAMPVERESYEINGLTFKVVKMSATRILQVEVRRIEEQD